MNILATSTTFIPSVILCGHSQLNYLEKIGEINYKFCTSHFINKRNIEWADVIVFIRSDTDLDTYVSRIAKKTGKHLVYVLDDDILNVPSYLISAPYYSLPSTKKHIKTIMSNCETFLTPSPVLLEKYGKQFKNAFLIDEPSLNRINVKNKNEKIKIGFAGSLDRAQDLNEILEGTIEKLVNKYHDQIDIEFMGAKPAFVDKYKLKHLPYQDGYDAYTAFMSKCNWDIGLAPMPISDFHKCKYFNKFVEYASFGTVGVYTNSKPYTFGIQNEVNGLLVNNNTDEWYNAIVKLIEDDAFREKLSKECLRQANEIYTLEKCSKDYISKVLHNYKENNTKSNIPDLGLAKFVFLIIRGFRKIKEEGTNFPNWLQKKIDKKIQDKKDEKQDSINKEKLKEIIKKQKSICIISPMFDDSKDEYNKRVKFVDDCIDAYKIYLSGEDGLSEHLQVNFIDDKHATIIYNSFDILQTEEVLKIIESTGSCLIHSVIRFMREKVSTEMYRVFDLNNTKIIWDAHGAIPEKYHELANYHTEQITNDLEKMFYDKSDVILCENEELKKHFIEKYNKEKDIVVLNNKSNNNNWY